MARMLCPRATALLAPFQMGPVQTALVLMALCAALPAQGAVLDVLDGETLYDGGFLLTVGQEMQRRETLRSGSSRVADPRAMHEQEQSTTMALQYGLRHDLQIGFAASWVTTDQVRNDGELHAEGLGEVELLAKYRFLRLDGRGFATNFALLTGVSLPTGDDDATSSGTELTPDLQPGSGSVDPMLGAAVTHEPGRWRFNAATFYTLRTDADRDGDRPGDELTVELAAGNRFWLEPYPGPFMRLDVVARYYHMERDRQDGEAQQGTGSERFTLGLNYAFRPRPALDFQLYVEVPIAQAVNETQLAVDWQADFTIGYRF